MLAGGRNGFEVLEDIKVGDVVVVKQGAMAIATVTEAQPKRRMGRAGKLNMNIDYVQLVDGEKVPLRAVKGGSGGITPGAMTGAIVATSIVFFPAAPFFLFMHGKDITIPKGTEITAYVAADTPLVILQNSTVNLLPLNPPHQRRMPQHRVRLQLQLSQRRTELKSRSTISLWVLPLNLESDLFLDGFR